MIWGPLWLGSALALPPALLFLLFPLLACRITCLDEQPAATTGYHGGRYDDREQHAHCSGEELVECAGGLLLGPASLVGHR